jgi:hypothetical protein
MWPLLTDAESQSKRRTPKATAGGKTKSSAEAVRWRQLHFALCHPKRVSRDMGMVGEMSSLATSFNPKNHE